MDNSQSERAGEDDVDDDFHRNDWHLLGTLPYIILILSRNRDLLRISIMRSCIGSEPIPRSRVRSNHNAKWIVPARVTRLNIERWVGGWLPACRMLESRPNAAGGRRIS